MNKLHFPTMPPPKKVRKTVRELARAQLKAEWAADKATFLEKGPYTCERLRELASEWMAADPEMFSPGEWPVERFSDSELVRLNLASHSNPKWFQNLFEFGPLTYADVARLNAHQLKVLYGSGFNLENVVHDLVRETLTTNRDRCIETILYLRKNPLLK